MVPGPARERYDYLMKTRRFCWQLAGGCSYIRYYWTTIDGAKDPSERSHRRRHHAADRPTDHRMRGTLSTGQWRARAESGAERQRYRAPAQLCRRPTGKCPLSTRIFQHTHTHTHGMQAYVLPSTMPGVFIIPVYVGSLALACRFMGLGGIKHCCDRSVRLSVCPMPLA